MDKIKRSHLWWAYWLFLTSLLSSLLYFRRDSLWLSPTAFDIAISIIWLALLLTPLFQEVSLFGLTFKKEFQELKADVRDQLLSVRTMMQVQSSVHVENKPLFNVSPSPAIVSENDKIKEET